MGSGHHIRFLSSYAFKGHTKRGYERTACLSWKKCYGRKLADSNGLWEALPLIEDSDRTTGAYFESLPPRKYPTEQEAMAAAKVLAQEQIKKLEQKSHGF